jgi:hypothetical protein
LTRCACLLKGGEICPLWPSPFAARPPTLWAALLGRKTPRRPSNQGPNPWLRLAQDAADFLQHLLEVSTRAERGVGARLGGGCGATARGHTADVFRFEFEDRIACSESGRVSYRRDPDLIWKLDIPLEAATNKNELRVYRVRRFLGWGRTWCALREAGEGRDGRDRRLFLLPSSAVPHVAAVCASGIPECPVKTPPHFSCVFLFMFLLFLAESGHFPRASGGSVNRGVMPAMSVAPALPLLERALLSRWAFAARPCPQERELKRQKMQEEQATAYIQQDADAGGKATYIAKDAQASADAGRRLAWRSGGGGRFSLKGAARWVMAERNDFAGLAAPMWLP